MEYVDFADKSLERFQVIQEKFKATYKIDDYANWNYNDATELLTLSTENVATIHFKYITIGTYSHNTNTWMWTWDKSDYDKSEILKVKAFGIDKNYQKLKHPYFESDIYDGWEFIAIANKILGGIGGYKVNVDHLEIYFLIKNNVDNDVAMSLNKRVVECELHGLRRMAYVCQHINKGTKVGFEEAFPSFKGMTLADEDDLQAWCNDCEVERRRTKGWNDKSMAFANIKIVCENCYFEMKSSNK